MSKKLFILMVLSRIKSNLGVKLTSKKNVKWLGELNITLHLKYDFDTDFSKISGGILMSCSHSMLNKSETQIRCIFS